MVCLLHPMTFSSARQSQSQSWNGGAGQSSWPVPSFFALQVHLNLHHYCCYLLLFSCLHDSMIHYLPLVYPVLSLPSPSPHHQHRCHYQCHYWYSSFHHDQNHPIIHHPLNLAQSDLFLWLKKMDYRYVVSY